VNDGGLKYLPLVFTDRLVPASSVYVPRLRAAFGFTCIDIVLQYTVEEDDVRKFNLLRGIVGESYDISCCKSGNIGKNLFSGNMGSKNNNQGSAGTGDSIEIADWGKNQTTVNSSKVLLNSDRFEGVSLKMMDCDGVSVKFESISKTQLDSILTNIIEVYNKTQSRTVQIFFKMICVKSSFANQITCLLATETTEYMVLRTPHEVRACGSRSHIAVRLHSSALALACLYRHHSGSMDNVILALPCLVENSAIHTH
jgi:hypothetical protein